MHSLSVWFLLIANVFEIACGIPRGICEKHGKHLAACDKIFVWNKDVEDFMSLSNETMNEPTADHLMKSNRTLKIVVHIMHPFVIHDPVSKKLKGYLGSIWNIIQEAVGFETDMTFIQSFVDGEKLVEMGEIDVFLGSGVAQDNATNTHYSQPFLMNWYNLYLKTPRRKCSTDSYLKTFSTPLWCTAGGIFAILSLSVFLTSKLLNRWVKVEPSISLPSCFLGVVSGFINQGFNLKLKSISGRIQILFALLLGVVLYSSMNAVLFSRLAVLDLEFPFASLNDLSGRGTESICLRHDSFVFEEFSDKNGVLLPQWKGVVNDEKCLDLVDQSNIDKIICNDNIVVFENRVVMSAVKKRTKFLCDVIAFPETFYHRGNVFMMSKSLKERFSIDAIMNKLRSSGIFSRLEHQWIKSLKTESTQSWNVVTIQHICGIIYAYLLMVVLSLIIFAMEILWSKYSTDHEGTSSITMDFEWVE